MNGSDESQVAPSGEEIPRCEVRRDQGRRAGRVNREVRPHQVQAVGDAARREIGDHGAGRIRTERRQAGFQLPLDSRELLGGVLRVEAPEHLQGLINAERVHQAVRMAAAHVASVSDDDLGPLPVKGAIGIPRVGERLMGHAQA